MTNKQLFQSGSRVDGTIQCRPRFECSDLNAHRHIYEYPTCSCEHTYEDALRFLIVCHFYENIHSAVCYYNHRFDLHTVVYGNNNYPLESNLSIAESVHTFCRFIKAF